ncbi:hypothetical protein WG907_11530 [Sphingobium sp. AN558]|uniref:hypothetical protein n=1 Tax=Sphingobium sp. AN558 TaxID=3133442 RepID=UPI0030C24AF8
MPEPSKPTEKIIVVYSGFRSSGTWFWSKLRENEDLHCYYEIFHEWIGSISQDDILKVKSSMWRSRHPVVSGYFTEYMPVIDGYGVPAFPAGDFRADRLMSPEGMDGDIEEDIEHYIQYLISSAGNRGVRPVLYCTRMLGRAHAIRKRFPGFHILLVRNLFLRWNSYSGQHRSGNGYFLNTLYSTLSLKNIDPYIAYISSIFTAEEQSSTEVWISEQVYDRIFCYFVAINIYFIVKTKRHCDLVIDINKVCADNSYRQKIENIILEGAGVGVDLSDACDSIDYPKYHISSVKYCREILNDMVGRLGNIIKLSDEEANFVDELLGNVWEEQKKFSFYTQSVAEVLIEQDVALREELDRRELEHTSLRKNLAALENEMLGVQHRALEEHTALQAALAKERSGKAAMAKELLKLKRTLTTLLPVSDQN